MAHTILSSAANVLVTGVTGMIGGEIVRKLHGAGLGKVWALVRPRDDADARTRLAERMQRSGEPAEQGDGASIEVLAGDITYPRWNLSAEDFARVTRCVDIIIHCAADTSFLCKKGVQDTNVAGTKNLIELASRCERRPLIVYMSTATNMGKISHQCLPEEGGCRPENEHHNEYTRSKAVAETLLRDSGLPLLILRPTIVLSEDLPDQKFAQMILWFVPLVRKFDCLPLDAASRLDIVPISFVVDATIDLLRKERRSHDCYHLSAGEQHCVTVGETNDFVNRFYRRRLPLRPIPPAEWTRDDYRTFVRTPRQRKIFFGMRYYLPFLNMDVVYDNRRLQQEVGTLRIRPLTAYMGGMLRRITARSALQEVAKP